MLLELPVVDSHGGEPSQGEPEYWRSLEHKAQSEESRRIAEGEFMPGALDEPKGHSRRTFFQLMAASMAMAGLAACRRPEEYIAPYTRQPEEIVPGVPLQYATAMPFAGRVSPLLVTAHEGRPTKVEGNPDHPASLGATGVFEQASILNLYDPDRSRYILQNGAHAAWQQVVTLGRSFVTNAATHRLAILTEASTSPTLTRLRDEFEAAYPNGRWITYNSAGDDNAGIAAQGAFGRPVRPVYRFSRAARILSLDADFLGSTDPNLVHNAREFADSRRISSPEEEISRVYAVESNYTSTGGIADHRLRLRSSDIPAFAAALANRLGTGIGATAGQAFANHPWIDILAEDLRAHAGAAVVVPGSHQPPALHTLCWQINQALGALGNLVELADTGEREVQLQTEALRELVDAMQAGEVDAIFIAGCNPVYDAPRELNFGAALGRVPVSIHLGEWYDETAQSCAWHVPRSHYLEAWGDGRAYEGSMSIIQPLISPLYDTKSDVEVINLLVTGRDQAGYDVVRETWRGVLPGDFEAAWRRVIHDGFLEGSGYELLLASPAGVGGGPELPQQQQAEPPEDIEVVFRLDNKVYDGRFANNAWMQELPEPITKVVWDNVALMSPATAERLGVSVRLSSGKHYTDFVDLTVGGNTVRLPVWPLPGHADDSITVHLGYGRNILSTRETRARRLVGADTDVYRPGPIGNDVGQNVSVLRTAAAMTIARNVDVTPIRGNYLIATSQEHNIMEGRPIARKATVDEFRENPTFAQDLVPPLPGQEPWEEYPEIWVDDHPRLSPYMRDTIYSDYQWAMVIDLNACTGCNACIIACQSENNVQVVGKDQVSRGRELHWLRLDRYFTGSAEDPRMIFQPMLCQHCENAPCEPVCPVAATTHSPDGINEMTYNRCIGTRYCSNNCPYKVRRFNFYNWTRTLPTQVQMAQNPHVTVRFRGVMEKCTFCIQRIRRQGETVHKLGQRLQDGDVMTACQQVCPSRAIHFGNMVDQGSDVSQMRQNPRRYELLAEYNTKPRLSYLGRVDNPNPRLARTT